MTRLERARIERAIVRAESGTTGRIVVRIVPDEKVDAFERARREFEVAGLHHTAERNVALILVAPGARAYAVLGDRGLHELVGDAFWQTVVSEMKPALSKGKVAQAILHAVERIGRELRSYFPAPIA